MKGRHGGDEVKEMNKEMVFYDRKTNEDVKNIGC